MRPLATLRRWPAPGKSAGDRPMLRLEWAPQKDRPYRIGLSAGSSAPVEEDIQSWYRRQSSQDDPALEPRCCASSVECRGRAAARRPVDAAGARARPTARFIFLRATSTRPSCAFLEQRGPVPPDARGIRMFTARRQSRWGQAAQSAWSAKDRRQLLEQAESERPGVDPLPAPTGLQVHPRSPRGPVHTRPPGPEDHGALHSRRRSREDEPFTQGTRRSIAGLEPR
jgi:hypothetical protein